MVSGCITNKRGRAGFNLTEMAIVLAVVGAVLSGIWSAMAISRENADQETTVAQIKQTLQNVRDFYQSVAETPAGDLTSDLIGHGAIVTEMIRNRTLPFTAAHAWDASTGGGSLQLLAASDRTSMFELRLTLLPQRACIGLSARLTAADGPRGRISSEINGTAMTGAVSPETAAAACSNTGSTNTLSLVYRLR